MRGLNTPEPRSACSMRPNATIRAAEPPRPGRQLGPTLRQAPHTQALCLRLPVQAAHVGSHTHVAPHPGLRSNQGL